MNARIDNWDDLRLFLAVARAGSLSGAARAVGVNHSTVFRRIGAFEDSLGVRLFDRLPSGYALTAAGEEMQASAERVEAEIAALDRRVTGQDLRLSGVVRITTVDMLAQGLLPRHLVAFRRAYPDIEIELTVGNATLSLTRREADVALRVGNQPSDTLVGRRVGRLVFAVYGSAQASNATAPLAEQPWIGFDAEHAPLVRSLAEFLPEVRPAFRVNSVAAAIAATKTGIGLATLPCGLADPEPGLMRVADLPDDFTLDLWLLTHEDLRRTARIRAFMDFLAEGIANEAALLEGRQVNAADAGTGHDVSLP